MLDLFLAAATIAAIAIAASFVLTGLAGAYFIFTAGRIIRADHIKGNQHE